MDSKHNFVCEEEIKRRQVFAQKACAILANIIKDDPELYAKILLGIWHGSLPRGVGVNQWDIDLGFFVRVEKVDELMAVASHFGSTSDSLVTELSWRQDVHYDGMRMWEAHTHLDPLDKSQPHLGIHFYRHSALRELEVDPLWAHPERPNTSFYCMLDGWQRLQYFRRHWIYEGLPFYDPDELFPVLTHLAWQPAEWFVQELRDAVSYCLKQYVKNNKGICTIEESREFALSLVALYAYAIEGIPMGRYVRFESDYHEFRNELARRLLHSVISRDLTKAAEVLHISG